MLEGTEIVESVLGDHSIIYGSLALAKEGIRLNIK